MNQDKPFVGIIFMLAFCVLAPLGDSIAKLLGGTVALGVLVLIRFAIQAAILVPLVALSGDGFRLPRGTLLWTLIRTCLHIIGIGMMFSALKFLPLADALAIAFVMPFIMLLLGHFVMGEEVGRQRMLACLVGFIGTLLVIQPNFVEVGYPALLPLGVAVVFALFMMVTRQVARRIDPIKLQAISGLQATAVLLPLILLIPEQASFDLSGKTVGLLALLGVIGTLAHLFMTWSLRFAPASTLAPMQYLEIPFGTAIGWLIFSDLPNDLAAVGICITVAAGLYIIVRERRLSRRPQVASVAE
ncbi:DMT family transporter [Yoonia sediminilitoris]|uniref:EamA-like transporter family protein n=1 Tax=Yoonia sediminilitoris TaxID=1286148 RepID=A0A2T6KEY8_9RHOB|nr:DMT family transporter [Yoonia sediminilitoris]PUB13667.1 EamA-like transporter family protein [Yoonia sediminilitoris]RCW94837.1 EamA-like transporter family protein [Yoonia sediminilitoris]